MTNDRDLSLPVVKVKAAADLPYAPSEWPANLPAVAQLLQRGITFGPLTVFVGGNGSGKSALVEGIAQA